MGEDGEESCSKIWALLWSCHLPYQIINPRFFSFGYFLSCNLEMLTHWHGVPTQMLLLESTTRGAWRDITPPWHKLWVGLFDGSQCVFWWFASSLISCQVSSKVCTNLGRCQVEHFLFWKFQGNVSLTDSAKFYHLWQRLPSFSTFVHLLTICKVMLLIDIWNWQSYCQLLSEIKIWHVFFRAYVCAEESRMEYYTPALVSLNSIAARTYMFFLPGKSSWGVHAVLGVSWGFCIIRAFILNIVQIHSWLVPLSRYLCFTFLGRQFKHS